MTRFRASLARVKAELALAAGRTPAPGRTREAWESGPDAYRSQPDGASGRQGRGQHAREPAGPTGRSVVYTLHLDPPIGQAPGAPRYKTAGHYTGQAANLGKRLAEHELEAGT